MKKEFIIILILLFWAGFVSSISFMEAWVKFQADGVTLPVGLSIGKKVFKTLNSVEWIFFFGYTIMSLLWVQWKKKYSGYFRVAFLDFEFTNIHFTPPLNRTGFNNYRRWRSEKIIASSLFWDVRVN